jgi:hypothetical protein
MYYRCWRSCWYSPGPWVRASYGKGKRGCLKLLSGIMMIGLGLLLLVLSGRVERRIDFVAGDRRRAGADRGGGGAEERLIGADGRLYAGYSSGTGSSNRHSSVLFSVETRARLCMTGCHRTVFRAFARADPIRRNQYNATIAKVVRILEIDGDVCGIFCCQGRWLVESQRKR